MIVGKKQPKPVLISQEYEAEYRIENNEAEFVKYTGTKEEYEVPEHIDGYPVTRIDRYAFAEHRNLVYVKLPQEIKNIGPHAFYNCRGLEHLEFSDKIEDIEDGAFKNCDSLHHMILRTRPDHRLNIKNILADTDEGILVTIYYEGEQKTDRAELIFPPYLIEYAENTPGRVLEKQAFGSGERYRNCLYDGQLNFEQYDKLLDFSVAVDGIEYPIQCAVNRLMYPYALKEQYREQYETFLKKHMEKVLSFYIKKEDIDTLKWMIDGKRLSKDEMELAMELSRTHGKNGLLPMFMEYQNVNFKPKKKSFDL